MIGNVTAGSSRTLGILSTSGEGMSVTVGNLHDAITSGPADTELCQSRIRSN